MRAGLGVLCLVALLTSAVDGAEPAPSTTREARLTITSKVIEALADGTTAVSDDFEHVVFFRYPARLEPAPSAVFDGKKFPLPVGATPFSIVFSPNGRHFCLTYRLENNLLIFSDVVAFRGMEGNPISIDDSGKHYSIEKYRGRKQFFVRDGVETPFKERRDDIYASQTMRAGHFAFTKSSDGGDGVIVCYDGAALKFYPHVTSDLKLTDDGMHLIFAIPFPNLKVLVDGQEVESWPTFSADSAHVAYWKRRGLSLAGLTIDGKPGRIVGNPVESTLILSADGMHYAYVTRLDKKQSMVRDGIPGPLFDELAAGKFSGDGKRLGYLGFRRIDLPNPLYKKFVVLDDIAMEDDLELRDRIGFDTSGTFHVLHKLRTREWKILSVVKAEK